MTKWRVTSGDALHLRSWDDEFVVHHSLSGGTHLLGAAAGLLLLRLMEAATDETTLAEYLCTEFSEFDSRPDARSLSETRDLLEQLQQLSLIERVA